MGAKYESLSQYGKKTVERYGANVYPMLKCPYLKRKHLYIGGFQCMDDCRHNKGKDSGDILCGYKRFQKILEILK